MVLSLVCCNACSVFRSAEENGYLNIREESHEIGEIAYQIRYGKLKGVMTLQDLAGRRKLLLEQINEYLHEFAPSERTVLTTYTKADLELDLGDTTAAVASYEQFLSGMEVPAVHAKDNGWGTWGLKSMTTNHASKQLADIYLVRSQFSDALRAISLTKKFVKWHYCGNERWYDTLTTRLTYAKAYLGLGRHDAALQILLPMVFDADPFDSESKQIPELTMRGLLHDRTQAEVLNTLDEALGRAYTVPRPERGEWTAVAIQFLGIEVELTDIWRTPASEIDLDSVVTSAKKYSLFYQLASNYNK